MPLSEKEKAYIVDKVVELLGATDKKEQIAALRDRVMKAADDTDGDDMSLDDAVYSLVQAIEELYG